MRRRHATFSMEGLRAPWIKTLHVHSHTSASLGHNNAFHTPQPRSRWFQRPNFAICNVDSQGNDSKDKVWVPHLYIAHAVVLPLRCAFLLLIIDVLLSPFDSHLFLPHLRLNLSPGCPRGCNVFGCVRLPCFVTQIRIDQAPFSPS